MKQTVQARNEGLYGLGRHPSRRRLPIGRITLLWLSLALLHPVPVPAQEWICTVRPGDNLWDITETHLSSMRYWRKLQALDEATDPEHMPPGSRLRIPVAWLRVQPTAARVVAVQGSSETLLAGAGETVPTVAGLLLHAGDAVNTGPDSTVTIEFGDGSRLRLHGDSELIMDRVSAYGDTGMVDTGMCLQRGRTETQVSPRQAPGAPRFEIKTPAAITAVRGTRYRVGVPADEPLARAAVLGGRVDVSGTGRTRVIPGGFGTVTKAGEAPPPPIKLLPPPDLTAVPPVLTRVPIELSFTPLAGAAAYRTQIALDQEPGTLLLDTVTEAPRIRRRELEDGAYLLRVRGIDSLGLEGIDADLRFTVNARPEPPFLITPQSDAVVREKAPAFEWAQPQDASGYHFQLADEVGFDVPRIDLPSQLKASLTPDATLDPGIYYWRVATRDRSGEEGPFSDPQQFRLQPAPPARSSRHPWSDLRKWCSAGGRGSPGSAISSSWQGMALSSRC